MTRTRYAVESTLMNIAMMLTWMRILAVPVIVLLYLLPPWWAHPAASMVFAAAALTDWFDGYVARSLSQTSRLGAFLDPVADKLLVASALILIVSEPSIHYVALPAVIIVGREITISALREWMAEIGRRASIRVSSLGKFKTVLQMFSLGFLLWYHPGGFEWVRWFGRYLLYIAAGLTVWSMFVYLRLAWPDLVALESDD